MPRATNKHAPTVRRITIDEKLATGLIRVLISELKPGTTEFDDSLSYWEPETDLLVRPDDLRKVVGMTLNTFQKWPWESLYEGQVFLQGHFVLKSSLEDNPRFVVDTRRKNLMCINGLIKNSIKQIYFTAIKGSVGNGQTDKN